MTSGSTRSCPSRSPSRSWPAPCSGWPVTGLTWSNCSRRAVMTSADPLRVLLVEDDEDDFVLTQSMLLANGRTRFDLEWEQSYAAALDAVRLTNHALYLVDYRLGEHTGLDLVRNAWGTDPPAPVILLTGQDDYAVEMEGTRPGG